MYFELQVQVHERDLPDVYELLAALTRARAEGAAPTAAVADGGASASERVGHEGIDAPEVSVLNDLSDEAVVLVKFVATLPDTARMNYNELAEKTGLPNIGAALQSISIRCDQHGVPKLIETRRTSKGNVYSMNARVAAIVRTWAGE